MTILKATYQQRLDAAGSFSAEFPLADPQTAELQAGRVYEHYMEGQGFSFAGSIEVVQKTPAETMAISGDSLLVELLHDNTLLAKDYTDTSVDDIIDDLLAGTGWVRLGSVSTLITVRFDGESKLRAILAVIEQAGVHCREVITASGGSLVRQLEIGPFGQDSGVVLSNGNPDDLALEDFSLAIISDGGLSVEDATTEVWNWILPLGAGEGSSQLTIVQQTRLPSLVDTNPSFESDLDNWTENPDGGTLEAVATHSVHGSQAAHVDGSGATDTYLSKSLPVSVGAFYTAEVWGWALTAHLTLRLEWHNAAHAVLATQDYDTGTTGKWERLVSTSFAAPSGATHCHLILHSDSVGDGYFDLPRFWRTASDAGQPYDIFTALTTETDLHAHLNWYISDPTSITSYGTRKRAFVAKDIVPLSATKPAFQVAANALYDLAAAQLDRWKEKQAGYTIECFGLDPLVKPGDKVRLRFKGKATLRGEHYMYLDLDTDVYILERQTTWQDFYVDKLTVSNIDRQLQNDDEVVIGKLEDTVRAFRTHVQTGIAVWAEQMGPEEVDLGADFDINARIPNTVAQLLRLEITITPRNIRSPVQVSTGESTHTHEVSGATSDNASTPAASGPAEGTPAANVATDPADVSGIGQHVHEWASVHDAVVTPNPTGLYKRFVLFDTEGGFPELYVDTNIADPDNENVVLATRVDSGHTHTVPSHSHGSHTHPAHTHSPHTHPVHNHNVNTVTSQAGSSHQHTIQFGIFEGTAAAGINILIDGVNRTAQLGGPWSAQITVDVTRFFLDDDSVVIQGDHTVKLTSVQLGRIEARLEWTAAVAAIGV